MVVAAVASKLVNVVGCCCFFCRAVVLSVPDPFRVLVDRLLVWCVAPTVPRVRGVTRARYARPHACHDFWLSLLACAPLALPLAACRYQRDDGREETMDFKLERDMHSFYKARKLGLDVSPAAVNTAIPVFYAEGLEVRRRYGGAVVYCSAES